MSVGTVSNALNRPETVSEPIRERVQEAVRRLGYVPSESTGSLPGLAALCANDLLALGVLQALYAVRLRVPEDIALVGYDDIEIEAAMTARGETASIPISRAASVGLNCVDEGRVITRSGAADPYQMRSSGERRRAGRVRRPTRGGRGHRADGH